MIGESVGCNINSVHRDSDTPAGRSYHVSSFYKYTGMTEDRFDPAFRGRLGIPMRPTVSQRKACPTRIGEDFRRCISTRTIDIKPRRPAPHRAVSISEPKKKKGVVREPRYFLYALHPEYTTTNSEYGLIRSQEKGTRAGLSSYVGMICKESTLEKVFH